MHGLVEGGQSGSGPARVDKRHSQAGEDIGFAFGRARPARQAQRHAELTDPGFDITELTRDNRRGLMSHRSVIWAWPPG